MRQDFWSWLYEHEKRGKWKEADKNIFKLDRTRRARKALLIQINIDKNPYWCRYSKYILFSKHISFGWKIDLAFSERLKLSNRWFQKNIAIVEYFKFIVSKCTVPLIKKKSSASNIERICTIHCRQVSNYVSFLSKFNSLIQLIY